MSPSILQVMLHIGTLIAMVKDVEKSIADLVAKKNVSADMKQVLEDVLLLLQSGLIQIPGMSSEQIAQVIKDIEASFVSEVA